MTSPPAPRVPAGLPAPVVPLLTDLVGGLSRIVPELAGTWVYGSIALGAFDAGTSDIDVIVATAGRLTARRIDRLAALHADLAVGHALGSRLEVQYLTLPELRGTVPAARYPVYREGAFLRSAQGDLNATTRWVLREHGVTLIGNSPAELSLGVTWEDVRAAMRWNLTAYWPSYATPGALPLLQDDSVVAWTVATLCRILSTVVDDVIVTKPAAVEIWAERVPERWSALLRAVRRLHGNADRRPPARSSHDRARAVQGFVIWACAAGLAALDRDRRVPSG